MTKVKTFEIFGEVKTINGVRTKTLPQAVEKQLGGFLGTIAPEDVVAVKQSVEQGGAASGGYAFITVIYNGKPGKPGKPGKEE